MKRRNAALALAMAMTLSSFSTTIFAGDALPPVGEARRGHNQATMHGYRVHDILNWSPETDPYAEQMRAHVPMQKRIEPFAPTQANPNLNPETEFFNLTSDYDNYFFGSSPYNNEFSQYLYNFWQYTDYYGGWHGVATPDVPENLYVPNGPWQLRAFEFGVLNLPNPSYTNAAHKNGVKSMACIFIPRAGQPYDALLEQREDGTFPVAEKLIEMKEYFGFDGYFINQETAIKAEDVKVYKEFTKTLVDAGIYVQWYDMIDDQTGGMSYKPQLIPSHSSFVKDSELGMVNHSIFMNYNWNSPDGWNNGHSIKQDYIKATVEEAERIGIDPLKTVFMGIEATLGRFNGNHNSTRNLDVILDKDGNPMASLAAITASFVQDGLDEDLGDGKQNHRAEDDYQWMIAERERMFYTGVKIDPTDTNEQPGYQRADVAVPDASQWTGISRYITERSVINGDTFVTNFNTGHGMDYYINGEISSKSEWSNINLQDILPTWQWWVESKGNKLQVDFDYGDTVEKGDKFTYQQIGGYNGGSSLVMNGKLDADNFIRLYKTDLEVKETTKASITYNKVSKTDDSKLQLGLIFEDSPEEIVYIPVKDSGKKTKGFVTAELDLSAYKGRKIATMGLGVKAGERAIYDYQMNIGELKVTAGESLTPDAPEGFEVAEVYNTSEVRVTWDMEDYEKVKNYHIYAVMKNGKEEFLGGTYDNTFYIKKLDKNVAKLKLVAVGADKTESKAAVIDFSFNDYLESVSVEETTKGITVNWDNDQVDVNQVKLVLTFTDGRADQYEATVDYKLGQGKLDVPVKEDDRYKLEVTALDTEGNVMSTTVATGKMKDVFSEAYEGTYYIKQNKEGETLGLTTPTSDDWWHMYVTIDGVIQQPTKDFDEEKLDYYIRGYHDLNDIAIPKDGAEISVVLEDYQGNKSTATTLVFNK